MHAEKHLRAMRPDSTRLSAKLSDVPRSKTLFRAFKAFQRRAFELNYRHITMHTHFTVTYRGNHKDRKELCFSLPLTLSLLPLRLYDSRVYVYDRIRYDTIAYVYDTIYIVGLVEITLYLLMAYFITVQA